MLKFTDVKRQEINLVFKIKVFVLAPKFGILINPFISISQKFGLLQILRARWGATDGEERALGLVGAQTRSHTKVRDYGRTDVEVGLSWPEEDNHVVSIHRGTMPRTRSSKGREEALRHGLLDHQEKHIHDRVEERGSPASSHAG
jgi:hypothetical protein